MPTAHCLHAHTLPCSLFKQKSEGHLALFNIFIYITIDITFIYITQKTLYLLLYFWSVNDNLWKESCEPTLVNCKPEISSTFKTQGLTNILYHCTLQIHRAFIPRRTFSKKWCVNSRHWCSHKHTAYSPAGDFSVFFGLYSEGAGTMEFQYHNCLFVYVPASEITGKNQTKPKTTKTKQKTHTHKTKTPLFWNLWESQNVFNSPV